MRALEALYRESGLTHRQIAAELGVSRSHVANVIAGRRTRPETAARIRRLLRGRVKPQSSDPEFLAQIRQVAIPLLRQRERDGHPERQRGISSRLAHTATEYESLPRVRELAVA